MTDVEARQFIRLCTFFTFISLHYIFPERKEIFYEDICKQTTKMANDIAGAEVGFLLEDKKSVRKIICDMTDLLQTDLRFCVDEFTNIENHTAAKL